MMVSTFPYSAAPVGAFAWGEFCVRLAVEPFYAPVFLGPKVELGIRAPVVLQEETYGGSAESLRRAESAYILERMHVLWSWSFAKGLLLQPQLRGDGAKTFARYPRSTPNAMASCSCRSQTGERARKAS